MQDDDRTREELVQELRDLRLRAAELDAAKQRCARSEEQLEKMSLRLGNREKELELIYGLSDIFKRENIACYETIQQIADLMPEAWQFPEITCVRITLEDRLFTTARFRETPWGLQRNIYVSGRLAGLLEVYYLEGRQPEAQGPFLEEECSLISVVAERIGLMRERELSKDALASSEHKYRTLLENLPQKIFYKDTSSVYVSCNRNFADALHLSPDDIAGKTDYDFFPRKLAEKYRDDDRRIMVSGRLESMSEPYFESGKELIIHTVKTPVRDENGTITGLLGIFWDITEQHKTQVEKERIEARLKYKVAELSIMNELSEVLLSTRSLDDILSMILIGVTAYQALGFNRAFLFLLNDSEDVLEGKLATGSLSTTEAYRTWERLSRDNTTLKDLLNSTRGKGTVEDEAINRLVRRIRIPLRGRDSIFARSVFNEESFNVIRGLENNLVDPSFSGQLGTDCFALVPLISRGKSLGVLLADNFINREPIVDEDVERLRAFANHASLAIENAHLYTRLEEKVSELSGAYNELRSNRNKLLQYERLSAVGEVAAQVAHDIRNPLMAIGGFARRILKKDRAMDLHRNYIDIIIREIDRLENILSDILSFTRPAVLHCAPARADDIIRSAFAILGPELDRKNIIYEERFDPQLPLLNIDEGQIRRVAINLIKNSIEAMPDGGIITASTAVESERVRIDITDSGVGIRDDDMDKLFNPFFTSKATGSGLGLTLSAQIISSHGGSIEVCRLQPRGTVFRINLPVMPPPKERGM